MSKPPTQYAGVVGIEPKPIVLTPDRPVIDWRAIAALPPFQMFAAERMRNTSGKDSEEHARDVVQRLGMGAELFQEYASWHVAKGYWPGEDAYGRAR